MKKKLTKEQLIEQEEKYVLFLQRKVQSKNFKANVSIEEYEKEQTKYSKAKLKLKFLKDE